MDADTIEIGKRIIQLRNKYDLTQKELGDKTGINRSYITNVETGKQFPSFDFLNRLLKTFNISLDWLITGNGQMQLIDESHIFNRLNDEHILHLEKILTMEPKKQSQFLKAINDLLKMIE